MSIERINISQVAYHQDRFHKKKLPSIVEAGPVSASLLSEIRQPLKFLTSEPKAQTNDMQWGSMVDCLWLTPDEWDQHFVTLPQQSPKRPTPAQLKAYDKGTAKAPTIESVEFWKKWDKIALGKTLVDQETLTKVRAARNMLDQHPIARYIWENSEKQVVLKGDLPGPLPQPGIIGKCMQDLWGTGGSISFGGQSYNLAECIIDLKQTHDTSEYGMMNACYKFEYPMKTAFYSRMAHGYGSERPYTILIFQNSNPPHDVHIRMIDPDDMREGHRLVQTRLDRLARLNPEDVRAHYDHEPKILSLADWMRTRQQEEE